MAVVKKIALEEHMSLPETLDDARGFVGGTADWPAFERQILDVGELRIELMDKNGVEFTLVSLNAPAVQAIVDVKKAIDVAKRANDFLAECVARHPRRFAGFAALPMQDPEAAAAELTRCVKQLGFKGALVNGFTQAVVADSVIYYDIPEYRDFWAAVSDLNAPFYLHPRTQIPSRLQDFEGHGWMTGSPWGFAQNTALHALRLCGSDLFERYPNLKIILGHLGERIPYDLWRIDARLKFARRGYQGKRLPGEYFRKHFYITTSGNFSDAAFQCAVAEMGVDHVLFSTDYPFEDMRDASSWFDKLSLNDADRQKIARGNAIALFDLKL